MWTSSTLTNGKQGSASFLRLILRTKPRRTRGWLITAVLRDVLLENAINMVIPDEMFLPVGTILQSFRVSAYYGDSLGAIRDQHHGRFVPGLLEATIAAPLNRFFRS